MASPYGASRSHSLDTPHSVGTVWRSDQLGAETSTWQHTTRTRDRYEWLRRDSNPQLRQAIGRRPTSKMARPPGLSPLFECAKIKMQINLLSYVVTCVVPDKVRTREWTSLIPVWWAVRVGQTAAKVNQSLVRNRLTLWRLTTTIGVVPHR